MIETEQFYEHNTSHIICCGKCWFDSIERTRQGEYTGDEAVYPVDLNLLPEAEPWQCDECGEQNAAYEELGELP